MLKIFIKEPIYFLNHMLKISIKKPLHFLICFSLINMGFTGMGSSFLFAANSTTNSVGSDVVMPACEIDLSGSGWSLWQDKEAQWKNDELFLPPVDLSKVPANPPTGGWERLGAGKGVAASVPGTAEDYLGDGNGKNSAITGVTWWSRTFTVPQDAGGRRIRLHFDSVRLRAEVYLNGKLVGYDVVGETPFDVDITDQVKPGQVVQLAVRVTNPGGSYTWVDTGDSIWGKTRITSGHGFSGITGSIKLLVTDVVNVEDIYMQNTPNPRHANAIITIRNTSSTAEQRDLSLRVVEKLNPSVDVFRKEIKGVNLATGTSTITTVAIDAPKAKLWDLDHPELYRCEVTLGSGTRISDSSSQVFGFRWFATEGQGQNALFRLNGKRIVLRTSISWGFWPNGLFPTPELAGRQVRVAKECGLNMLNFHRNIGNPIVMDKADESGLLYFEEPGGYTSAHKDPFARALAREKLLRMIKRDRSHPCVIIYNMINEQVGNVNDEEQWENYLHDLTDAHGLDPSRTIVLVSGFAGESKSPTDKNACDRTKLHMLPYDDKPYLYGWWDGHRAGGPVVWNESFYGNPKDHYGYTGDTAEFVYRGEEGAMSAPPRLALIKKELDASPRKGWDGAVYLQWYDAFADFLKRKGLDKVFPTVDDLCTAMGAMSISQQGHKIELARICDANDGYAINGWEAQIIENHSGVVDEFRNPKADPAIMAYYNQPLYVAVKTRNQVVKAGDPITVDFYAVNELDMKGACTLKIKVADPSGKEFFASETPVTLAGGDVYGQLLVEAVSIPTSAVAGTCRIEASLVDSNGKVQARGHEQVMTVDWKSTPIPGKGAVLEVFGKVREFLKSAKGFDVPAFDDTQGPLDWIVVSRPQNFPSTIIPQESLKQDTSGKKQGLHLTFFSGLDFKTQLGQRFDSKVDASWFGNPPDSSVKQIENYSVRWEGALVPPLSGDYIIRTKNGGAIRLWIDDKEVVDSWRQARDQTNEAHIKLEAGKPVSLRIDYAYAGGGGSGVHLEWTVPAPLSINPARLFERAKKDGTTLIFIDAPESWMDLIAKEGGVKFNGIFELGKDWLGGQYFVREHPLFKDLPVNCGMDWPYQAVLLSGKRYGLNLDGEELVAGCYQTWPMNLGTAVGVIPCGKGRIIVSTLNITDNLASNSGPAQVARKLLCNYLNFAVKQ